MRKVDFSKATKSELDGCLFILGQELADKRNRLTALTESIENTETQIAEAKQAQGVLELKSKQQVNGQHRDHV